MEEEKKEKKKKEEKIKEMNKNRENEKEKEEKEELRGKEGGGRVEGEITGKECEKVKTRKETI